ncbi:MAG TPA: metal-dependent hydrolase [Bryobacteraceae bacterium]|jgi:inner membrane protein|nr:metal-dependent hydrolase [Bryobacteraceae bacterium]
MENVTHSLTGLALARAGLNRLCPRATLLLILSANAPDIDIIGLRNGPLHYLEVHRGYTHSLLCLPLMALLALLVTAAICRQKLPWIRAWLLCCLGVASHLLLDWTNSYGVRLGLPFSSRWFHLDLNALSDVWILCVLVLAALWPSFVNLVSREIGDRHSTGRGSAIFALVFFLLFDLTRGVLHNRAYAQLNARLYDGTTPLQLAALPDSLSPLHWTGIVETGRSYLRMPVHCFQPIDERQAKVFYKPAIGPGLKDAARTPPFLYFQYFARFPVWSEEPFMLDDEQGKRIDLSDLRFGAPGVGSFHCIAIENSRNQVLKSWFTYGAGTASSK